MFASVDSEYSLLSWASTVRKDGGLGGVNIPLLSDKNHKISKAYGVLLEDEGVALRGLFIVDPNGVVRQVWPLPSIFFCCIFIIASQYADKRTTRSPSTICLWAARSTRRCVWSTRSSSPRRSIYFCPSRKCSQC